MDAPRLFKAPTPEQGLALTAYLIECMASSMAAYISEKICNGAAIDKTTKNRAASAFYS